MEATIDDIVIEKIIDLWDRHPDRSRDHPKNRMNVFWKFIKMYPKSVPMNKRYTGGNSLLEIEDWEEEYKKAILKELERLWTS